MNNASRRVRCGGERIRSTMRSTTLGLLVMFGALQTTVTSDYFYHRNFQHHYDVIDDDVSAAAAIAAAATVVDDDDAGGVRPSFRPTPRNVTLDAGQRAILRCRVDNLGAKIVTWRRTGDLHPMTIGLFTFVSDPRVSVEYNKRTSEWSLIIDNCLHTDEGPYQCQVNSKDDKTNFYEVYLHVRTVQISGTEFVDRGSPIRIVCNITGRPDPPHDVDWFKDGRVVESDAQSGLVVTKKIETKSLASVLTIRRSKMTDAGEYFCRSTDDDVGRILVHVLSAPVEKRGTSIDRVASLVADGSAKIDTVETVLMLGISLTFYVLRS